MAVRKQTLRPGTHLMPILVDEADKKVQKTVNVSLEPSTIKQFAEGTKQLIADGFKIPFLSEHAPRSDSRGYPAKVGTPEFEAFETDPYFLGLVGNPSIAEDGSLELEYEVTPELESRLKTSGAMVSPQFGTWERDGKKYQTITHVALTRKPVDKGQNPVFSDKVLAFSEIYENTVDPIFVFGDNPDGHVSGENWVKVLEGLGLKLIDTANIDEKKLKKFILLWLEQNSDDSKQEPENPKHGMVVMSQATSETVDKAKFEQLQTQFSEFQVQFSALKAENAVLSTQVTEQKKLNLLNRVNTCLQTGRCRATDAESLRNEINQFQFSSNAGTPAFETRLELFESFDEGQIVPIAVPSSKSLQFSLDGGTGDYEAQEAEALALANAVGIR